MVAKLKLSVLYAGVRRAGFDYVINILMPSSKKLPSLLGFYSPYY